MTRFDAADPAERRKLYVDAITAHRNRGSGFLTLEADAASFDGDSSDAFADEDVDEDVSPGIEADVDGSSADLDFDPELGVPWLQFGDGTVNLDCTDDELDELKGVLAEFPAFKIDELTRPDEADGINVRVSAKADPNRIAQFLDATFQRVYGLPAEFRVWVVEI